MPKLHVSKVRSVGRVALNGEAITIGRSSQSKIVLPSNSVSRRHAVIEIVDGQARIRDLGSHVGTKVNGRTVEVADLYDGDRIQISRFEIIYQDPDAERPIADLSLKSSGGTGSADFLALDDTSVHTGPDSSAELMELQQRQAAIERAQHELERQQEELAELRVRLQAQEKSQLEQNTQLEADRDGFAKLKEEWLTAHREQEASRESRQDELSTLTEEFESLRAKYDEERAAAELLQRQLREQTSRLEQQLADLSSERSTLAQERDALLDASTTPPAATAAVTDADDDAETLRHELQNERESVEAQRVLLSERQQNIDELQIELTRQKNRLSETLGELEDMRERQADAEQQRADDVKQLETQLAAANELAEQSAVDREQFDEQSTQLNQVLVDLEKREQMLVELEDKHQDALLRLTSAEETAERLAEELAAACAERDSLRDTLEAQLATVRTELAASHAQHQAAVKEFEQQRDSNDAALNTARESLQAVEQQIAALQTASSDLEAELATAHREREEIESLFTEREQELVEKRTTLEADLAAQVQQVAALQLTIEQNAQHIARLDEELASEKEAKEAALTASQQAHSEKSSLSERLEELVQLHSSLTQEHQTLSSEADELVATRDALAQERDQQQEELDRTARDLTDANDMLTDVRRLVAQHEEGLTAAREQLAAEKHANEQYGTRLAAQVDDYEKRLATLREQADKALDDLMSKSQKLTEVTGQAAALKDQITRLEDAHQIVSTRAGKVEGALEIAKAFAQRLKESSRVLSSVQCGLRALEVLWIETDERLEEAESIGPDAVDQVLAERDAIAAQLEDAHTARDEAIAEMQAMIDRTNPTSWRRKS